MLENEKSTLDLTIDELFKDPDETTSNLEYEESEPEADSSKHSEPSELTKSMSNRINEVKQKTERETRDTMAKELGYNSYSDFQKAQERKTLEEAGLDDTELEPIIQKLLDKRFREDPRMKRLEELEAKDKADFVKNQINEINNFAGTKYKDVSEFPQDVLNIWEKTGNLKQAYLAIQGEVLINKSKTENRNGSLNHLASSNSNGIGVKQRCLSEDEKAIWRSVFPDITDEELNKKTRPID